MIMQILKDLKPFFLSQEDVQGGVCASDGSTINPDALPQTMGYTDGVLTSISVVTPAGVTYKQTLTYTNGLLTGVSSWIRSPQ